MHTFSGLDCLYTVITAQEASQIWELSRNAISQACRIGSLRGRRSSQTWLITIADMLHYQKGRYYPENVPDELRPAFDRAVAEFWGKS